MHNAYKAKKKEGLTKNNTLASLTAQPIYWSELLLNWCESMLIEWEYFSDIKQIKIKIIGTWILSQINGFRPHMMQHPIHSYQKKLKTYILFRDNIDLDTQNLQQAYKNRKIKINRMRWKACIQRTSIHPLEKGYLTC